MKKLLLTYALLTISGLVFAQDSLKHSVNAQQRMVAKAYLKAGLQKFVVGDYNNAYQNLANCVKLNPDDTIAWEFYGLVNCKLNGYLAALTNFAVANGLDSTIDDVYYQMAIIKRKLGDNDDVVRDLSKVIELNPSNADAYLVRGITYFKLKMYKEGILDFNELISLQPIYANANINSGIIKEREQNYRGAVKEYTTSIGQNKEDFLAFFYRANARTEWADRDGGGVDGAIADVNFGFDLSRINEMNGWLYNEIVLFNLANYTAALECFNKVIDQYPTCAEAYYYAAETMVKQKDPINAMKNYDRAIELNSNYALAWYKRGLLKLSSGDTAGACSDFKKAAKMGRSEAIEAKNKYCK